MGILTNGNILILCGVGILVFAYMDYRDEETNMGILSSWIHWIKVDKEESPQIYWTLLTAQVLLGIFGIYYGLAH